MPLSARRLSVSVMVLLILVSVNALIRLYDHSGIVYTEAEKQEREVYTTLLSDSRFIGRSLVISEYTGSFIKFDEYHTEDDYLSGLKSLYPAFQAETFTNHIENNKTSIAVPDDLWLGFNRYDILKDSQRNPLDFPAYTWLTRVGFNHDYTQALLYMGGYCGMMCGGVSVYILEKVEGQWVVKASKQVLFF